MSSRYWGILLGLEEDGGVWGGGVFFGEAGRGEGGEGLLGGLFGLAGSGEVVEGDAAALSFCEFEGLIGGRSW